MVPDTLAYLLGTWAVERELVDRVVRVAGTFRGTATFLPVTVGSAPVGAPGGGAPVAVLEHVERGELVWGGVAGAAERTLRVLAAGEGTARVTFADGRDFHDLDLRSGSWTAVHPCVADDYTGTFTVTSPDEWRTRWDVSGPAKDQTLTTVYRRVRPV